jgi:DNA-binding transcriptional regulator YhcF (GntR family)
VATTKIHLRGQFAINRNRVEPLSLQIARQLQEAIEAGCVPGGTQLPSTRSLARTLGVSRNTVLTAYDELAARGFVRGCRGAGMYVLVPTTVSGFDLRSVMREAQYPSCTIVMHDPDGNLITLTIDGDPRSRQRLAESRRSLAVR